MRKTLILGLQFGNSNLMEMAEKMLQVKNGIQQTRKQPINVKKYI